jgi:hypothetical protein
MNDLDIDLFLGVEAFEMSHYRVRELVSFVRQGHLWCLEYAIDAYCRELPLVSRLEAEIQVAWMCRHA